MSFLSLKSRDIGIDLGTANILVKELFIENQQL